MPDAKASHPGSSMSTAGRPHPLNGLPRSPMTHRSMSTPSTPEPVSAWPSRSLRWGAAVLAAIGLAGCVVAPPREVHHGPPPRPVPEPMAAPAPMYFYPQQGQGEERQDRDRYECYRWAVRQTGVDPGMQPLRQAPAPEPAPVTRSAGPAVAGAATGAIVGGVVSSPRNAGAGMVLGALFGGMLGAAAEENRAQAVERAQDARARRWEANQVPLRDFHRAIGACMEGRGYAVR